MDVETANAGAWGSEGVGAALVRGLVARGVARVAVSACDWSPGPGDSHVRDIPGGRLVRAWADKWGLGWLGPGGEFQSLSSGTLAQIEDDAQEVVLFGLPGGVCPAAAPLGWSVDEGSLRRVRTEPVMRGTFWIMMYSGGRAILVFVRQDYRVVYLGAGKLDELKATADERLARRHGVVLRVRCAGQTHDLLGLGFLGGVGQTPLIRGGTRLMLVQVGFDQFELRLATPTGESEVVGEYRGADLERGDLGEILGPLQHGAHRTDDANARPRRQSRTRYRRTRYQTAKPAPDPQRTAPPLPSAVDLLRLANCLEWKPTSGNGKSELANVYAAFRELRKKGLGNLLLWAKEWRTLIETKTDVRFGPCDRTVARALALFLKITGLGRKEGRRFRVFLGDLERGDTEVWETIRERFPPLPQPQSATSPTPAAPTTSTLSPTDRTDTTAAPASTPPTAAVTTTATPPAEAVNTTPIAAPANPPTAAVVNTTWTTAPASTPPVEAVNTTPTVATASTPPAESVNTTPPVAPASTPPAEAQEPPPPATPAAAPDPSAGAGAPRVDKPPDDPWLLAALYHSGLATGVREADLESAPTDLTGPRQSTSYLRDEDRWKPYCDRSWTKRAPSQFSGKAEDDGEEGQARGPPKTKPPKR